MTVAVYSALLAALVVPLVARLSVMVWLADHLCPVGAVVVVAVGGVALAVCSTVALVLLVVAGVSSSTAGSASGLGLAPVRVSVGVVAAVTLAALVVRGVGAAARLTRQYRAALGALPPGTAEEVVVVDGAGTPARALPVHGGRILVADGPWRRLGPAEQAVVLAHERAHLRRRHHLYLAGLTLAVALNPLLAPLRRVLEYGLERDADEQAAAHRGQRRILAETLAALALAEGGDPPGNAAGLGITPGVAGSLVVPRVAALLSRDAAENDRLGVVACAAATLVTSATVLAAAHAAVELRWILIGGAG